MKGSRPMPSALRQLPDRPVRPHGDQQVEAEHGRRQDQRQRDDGADDALEARARARQPPGDRRADDEQENGHHAGQLEGQPDGGEVGAFHAVSVVRTGRESYTGWW